MQSKDYQFIDNQYHIIIKDIKILTATSFDQAIERIFVSSRVTKVIDNGKIRFSIDHFTSLFEIKFVDFDGIRITTSDSELASYLLLTI